MVFLGLEIGYFGVNRLNVRKLTLESDMIPTAFTDTSLLVFSDVYGNEAQLKKVQNIVASEKPDLIIFLGNLLNEDTEEVNIIMNTLKSMEAPLGKFAILGAHDYTLDMDVLRSLYETSDFMLIETISIPIFDFENICCINVHMTCCLQIYIETLLFKFNHSSFLPQNGQYYISAQASTYLPRATIWK